MLNISGNEEHRNFQGHIYVIRREKGKMIGVTYLVSKGRKQTKDFVKYHKASQPTFCRLSFFSIVYTIMSVVQFY